MKLAVPDYVYWGVIAIANSENRTHGQIMQDLVSEALRWRSLAADLIPQPSTEIERAIAEAAGLEASRLMTCGCDSCRWGGLPHRGFAGVGGVSAPKADNLPLPPLPSERFDKVSLDCPWHFRSRAASQNPESDRSPQAHYPTMDLAHLKLLPVRQIAKPDAHVFLWITGPLIVQGVHNLLFSAWGVQPSSMAFVWVKTGRNFEMEQLRKTALLEQDLHFGMGFTTRQNAEYVVLGRIGSPARARADIRPVIVAPVSEHSRKPDEYYRRVEHYARGSQIDMFAGADRPNWTRWGWGHRDGEGNRCDDAGEAA